MKMQSTLIVATPIQKQRKETIMKAFSVLAFSVACALSSGAFAIANAAQHDAKPVQAAETEAPMSEGEIKKVDKEASKITIKHGELKNLDMPPMTMVFRVTDPAMLDQVKAGNKIRFVAEKVNGAFTVTKLEIQK